MSPADAAVWPRVTVANGAAIVPAAVSLPVGRDVILRGTGAQGRRQNREPNQQG